MAETPIDWPTNSMKAFFESAAGDAWRSAMLRQTERFWEAQRKLLDEYETFSRTLLERRRTATEAALETVRKMGACRDGGDWAQCCSDWIAGSVARVAADSRDMLEESMKVLSDFGQSMSAGMSEAADTAAAAKDAASRETASARGAALAQTAAAMEAAARAAKIAPRFKKPGEGAHP
jgi:phasin protein